MRLFLLIAGTMLAFAANSVLNRLALAQGSIDPAGFALVRLATGGAALWIMVAVRGGSLTSGGVAGGLSLAAYILGFSFAYVSLDTGVGALILFGGVQVTMFLGALYFREKLPLARFIGAFIAFSGLVYLLWPVGRAEVPVSPLGTGYMIVAAVGWGMYSLIGRGVNDPLATTAGNFLLAIPPALLAVIVTLSSASYSALGVALAAISGVVTSGIGYAVWYTILPKLPASLAAISMLTVPIIASLGGVLILSEPLTLKLVIATVLVLVGVLISLKPASAT